MPDQLPRSRQIVRANALYFPLLHSVLAKVPHARLEGFLDGDGRMGLRDADESDVFGAPPNAICSGRDSFLYPKKIFFGYRKESRPLQIALGGAPKTSLSSASLRPIRPSPSRKPSRRACGTLARTECRSGK